MKIEWKQVVVALVTGLLLGGAVGVWALKSGHLGFGPDRFRNGMGPGHRMLERFDRELNLTPEQRDHIREILDAKRQQISALSQEKRPQFQEIRRSTREEIRKILTPEQQARFDTMKIKRGDGERRRGGPR